MNTTWSLDKAHSELQFKVKHMMISNVSGNFHEFDAFVQTDGDDFSNARVNFYGKTTSICTNNEQRDNHLKSKDFFDTNNHPHIEFVATKLERKTEEEYKLTGNLTIKGITKPLILGVEFGGTIKDISGFIRAGFTIYGSISRKEYGLNWNAFTEAGGLVVGDDVKIHANMEFTKAA